MSKVDARLEEWKRKLIDLTRRNKLLFYTPARSSSLKILQPSISDVFARMIVEEKPWRIFAPQELETKAEPDSTGNLFGTVLPEPLNSSPTPQRHTRRSDELVCEARETSKVRVVLRNLYRRSRSDFEERGVRILHAVFGMLNWREIGGSEVINSPIVLVPAQLNRESANKPFELGTAEEDVLLNPALEVKFRNDFRIELPSLPEDWEGVGIDAYLNEVESWATPHGWTVSRECFMGLFSFHKLVIYRDLETHADLIKINQIVRALAREAPVTDETVGGISSPEELDRVLNPKDSFLVRDADSSQLACIETVKNGVNLVIQGPPGTGKSQTIANLIAESIARGRTVLFMSEKMAALDVVYKRLLEANLGHYCLELHSHKANKKQVAGELYKSYCESLHPKSVMSEEEFERLKARRQQLNDYVNALHLVREPLGRNAYDVLGELAELASVTSVTPTENKPAGLTPARLDAAVRSSKQLARVWGIVQEGMSFPWRGCGASSFGAEVRTAFQSLIDNGDASLRGVAAEAGQYAETMGLQHPESLREAKWMFQLVELLAKSPGVETDWFEVPNLILIANEVREYRERAMERQKVKSEISVLYLDSFFDLQSDLEDQLKSNLGSLSTMLGRDLQEETSFASQRGILLGALQELRARLEDWSRDAKLLGNLFGMSFQSIDDLSRLIHIARLCRGEDLPDAKWLDPIFFKEATVGLQEFRILVEARNKARSEILRKYDESFLSLDLKGMANALATRYASPFRWIKPGFYRTRRQILRCRRDGRYPDNALGDLRAGLSLLELETKFEAKAPLSKGLLGPWFRGYDTDFIRAGKAIRVARELLELLGGRVPKELVQQACYGSIQAPEIREASARLHDSLSAWENDVQPLLRFLPLDRLPATGLPIRQSSLSDISSWVDTVLPVLENVKVQIDTVAQCQREPLDQPPKVVFSYLAMLARVRGLEKRTPAERDRLQRIYGSHFAGLATDWDQVLLGIEWTQACREHLRGRDLPASLRAMISHGAGAAPKSVPLETKILKHEDDMNRLVAKFAEQDQLSSTPEPTTEADHAGGPHIGGVPLLDCPFNAGLARLREMKDRVDEIRDWIDYRTIEADFRKAGLHDLHAELVRRPSLIASDLERIVRRALLSAWIDWVFKQDAALGHFRVEDHEAVIREFRELDRNHWKFGAQRVILAAEQRKPKGTVIQPGGEAAVVAAEAAKRRRHLPIRHLFARIPNLLIRLKPCLLMSPLSVSQFLDPKQVHFDLVIFDEASQICSEDAVGAIYRGGQLVVCGDSKQLPPTAFFEQGMADDFEDLDADDAFDIFDSVLDECVAIGMPHGWLRWHYRSKHESLIAFSNHRFYDNRLVTFPAAHQTHPGLGIQFIHVADGVYDRGNKRNNEREAEVVIGLVADHYRKRSNQSLGVVAFSVAQMNAIEDRLEQLLRDQPELERFFAGDRLEGFFVKNLESVQGDERDVIIFSVGYGRDQNGRLTMHFGPLNLAGGERRLNVAVTRAREKVIVVSSIQAADFDLAATSADGVRALYHYLDYAERGTEALGLVGFGAAGDFESPLERDVAGAIRAMGYEVIPQVGCSGFRIDLGVLDPREPGHFILGVECDGATYHSSYTARDRDRLRQQVLEEELGWHIHRIWSPDWVTRKETEVRRLHAAIEQATFVSSREKTTPISGASENPRSLVFVNEKHPQVFDDIATLARWSVIYVPCVRLTRPPRSVELHDVGAREPLKRMLKEVVSAESPVHFDVLVRRILENWGLQRAGNRIQEAVRQALRETGDIEEARHFLWWYGAASGLRVRRPDPRVDRTMREIDHIPDEELELGILMFLRDAFSMVEDDLLVLVARLFGFDRTGQNIRGRVQQVIEGMIRDGVLARSEDRLARACPSDSRTRGEQETVDAQTPQAGRQRSHFGQSGGVALVCSLCGAKNRLPASRRAGARCGHCKAPL